MRAVAVQRQAADRVALPVKHAAESVNRVFAETREDNVKSEKVLERCGFDLISDGKLKKWGKNL